VYGDHAQALEAVGLAPGDGSTDQVPGGR